MDRRQALQRVLFLRGLAPEAMAELAESGNERTLAKGELLFAETSPCMGLIVVLTGAVKMYKLDSRGHELTISLEEPGDSVAEVALFDGGNYPASAQAVKDSTTVLIVRRERFLTLMESHPDIATNALRALGIRMRRQIHMTEVQSLHSVRTRLASYLLQAAGDQLIFQLQETNDEIASHIGSVRDVVSRTLCGLRDNGSISVDRRKITILDADALRTIANAKEYL